MAYALNKDNISKLGEGGEQQPANQTGVITPTFKIKRNVLETRYATQFDGWTSGGKRIVWAA